MFDAAGFTPKLREFMRLTSVSEKFIVNYGTNYEFSSLTEDPCGIAFVSRSASNNGITGRVVRTGKAPFPAGAITVALGGSVLSTFLQTEETYQGRDIAVLLPIYPEMSSAEKLWYVEAIKAHRFRFSYGRQANRELPNLKVPVAPDWVTKTAIPDHGALKDAADVCFIPFDTKKWCPFSIENLFTIKKGKRLTQADMTPGLTPFIGATAFHNGVTASVDTPPMFAGGCISVAYNGSVGEAFYQSDAFCASDDVNVLIPKMKISPLSAILICTMIRTVGKTRFGYGRKWSLEKMRPTVLKLPSSDGGKTPCLASMEAYMRTLPFSGMFAKPEAFVPALDVASLIKAGMPPARPNQSVKDIPEWVPSPESPTYVSQRVIRHPEMADA